MDKARRLYLVAYDIADSRRLQRVCRYLSGYRVAGQKSVFEIWVTPAELRGIERRLGRMIDPDADRVHCIGLDPRMKPWLWGQARHFSGSHFSIT